MTGDVCATCGLEKIGGRCLTRWCDDRHPSVDAVLDDLDDREIRTDGGTDTSDTDREWSVSFTASKSFHVEAETAEEARSKAKKLVDSGNLDVHESQATDDEGVWVQWNALEEVESEMGRSDDAEGERDE